MATDAALWRPTVGDVSALLANRPGDDTGRAQTTFDSTTTPTDAQVAVIIGQVQGEVIAETGDMPALLATVPVAGDPVSASPAGNVVTLGAAARVERQFFPDLQTLGESPAAQWQAMYEAAKKALVASVYVLKGGGTLGEEDADVLLPSWAFPAAVETGAGTPTWGGF